jgi:hypothetical protein
MWIEILFWVILWYVVGFVSFIYWWTTENDYTTSQIPISICVGFMGPIAFIIGWSIHGGPGTTIFKRKE